MKHIIVTRVFKLMKGPGSPERTNSVRYCETHISRLLYFGGYGKECENISLPILFTELNQG